MNRSVFFISDGTGITAETLGHSLLAQFGGLKFDQFTLPYVDSPERAHDAVKKIDLASQCIYSKYVNVVLAAKKTEAIESISLNTINRFVAYEQFKSALSSAPSLRSEGDGCLPMIRMSYLQKNS